MEKDLKKYYAIWDNGDYLHTGRNETDTEEVRKQLLDYLYDPGTDAEEDNNIRATMSLESLCDHHGLRLDWSDTPF